MYKKYGKPRCAISDVFDGGGNPLYNHQLVGQWLSWESASLARMRSWVRIPSAPPKYRNKPFEKLPVLIYGSFSFILGIQESAFRSVRFAPRIGFRSWKAFQICEARLLWA